MFNNLSDYKQNYDDNRNVYLDAKIPFECNRKLVTGNLEERLSKIDPKFNTKYNINKKFIMMEEMREKDMQNIKYDNTSPYFLNEQQDIPMDKDDFDNKLKNFMGISDNDSLNNKKKLDDLHAERQIQKKRYYDKKKLDDMKDKQRLGEKRYYNKKNKFDNVKYEQPLKKNSTKYTKGGCSQQ